jgi:hypothetical protein
MSRRASLFVLATSAALIATQASAADPKCTGSSCANAPTEAQLRSQPPSMRHGHFRHVPPYRNGYVVGLPVGAAPFVVAGAPFAYGGYYGYGAYEFGRPVYLFAPNAKIIHVDRD